MDDLARTGVELVVTTGARARALPASRRSSVTGIPALSGEARRWGTASPARKVGGGFEIAYLDADGVMVHAMHVAGFSDDGLGEPTAAGQLPWFGIIADAALNAPGGFATYAATQIHIRGLAMKNGVLYTMGDADAGGYPALTEALP